MPYGRKPLPPSASMYSILAQCMLCRSRGPPRTASAHTHLHVILTHTLMPMQALHAEVHACKEALWPLYTRKRTHGQLGPLDQGQVTTQLLGRVVELSSRQAGADLLTYLRVRARTHTHMLSGVLISTDNGIHASGCDVAQAGCRCMLHSPCWPGQSCCCWVNFAFTEIRQQQVAGASLLQAPSHCGHQIHT